MSEAFLPTDLALFAGFKSVQGKNVQGNNVVEFIDVMVQSLNYRFTSSKINEITKPYLSNRETIIKATIIKETMKQ
jgi:hypothetical protein